MHSVGATTKQDGRELRESQQHCVAAAVAGDVLRREGYELDSRPYQPHVSLGRLRLPLLRGQPAALVAALQARTWPGSDAFVARAVYLMRSDLFPDGARYTVLGEATLDGRP